MKKMTPKALNYIAGRFKLLGEPTRLQLLYLLKSGERCVQELTDVTHGGQANVSKHLSLMASNGMLGRRREGLHVYYFIKDQSIFDLCEIVCGSLEDSVRNLHDTFTNE